MATDNRGDFNRLTFSQREGEVPLPEPMRAGHIPDKFRRMACRAFDMEIDDSMFWDRTAGKYSYRNDTHIGEILFDYRFDVRGVYSHKIPPPVPDPKADQEDVYQWIMKREYHEALTLVEYTLRHLKCRSDLRESLLSAFDECEIAYFVEDIGGRPTIVPRASQEAGAATQQALETLREADMDGASAHLRQAAEHINARQYGDAVTDTIHAVESVARRIDPKASRTLGPALDSLEKAGVLNHPALKEAFKKLYGYTNDEQGLRHPLRDKASPDVDLDDAMFMFGACASFAAYLANRHRRV